MVRKNVPADVFRFIDTKNNNPDVCWPWFGSTGGRDDRPYITIDGKKKIVARVVYELFYGPIPERQVVRHTCDNPPCCNPTHYVLGTRTQNENDKYDRDRAGYTHNIIYDIRRLHKLGMTYADVAGLVNEKHKTNISASGVGKVIRGERRAGHAIEEEEGNTHVE